MPDYFFALRGSRQLSKEEFESHLALAIRLENVAVLLGAGASNAWTARRWAMCGLPSRPRIRST